MTKLMINMLKKELNEEPSQSSTQGTSIKRNFNMLEEQLGPNIEAMSNFFGNISGIDKFDLTNLNPFKKVMEGNEDEHHAPGEHTIYNTIDGKVNLDGSNDQEYNLYKKLEFQKLHNSSQGSWILLWGAILVVLIIIKLYFFFVSFATSNKAPGMKSPDMKSPSKAPSKPTSNAPSPSSSAGSSPSSSAGSSPDSSDSN